MRLIIAQYFKSEEFLTAIKPLALDKVTQVSLYEKYLQWVTASGMDKYVSTCMVDCFVTSKTYEYDPVNKTLSKKWLSAEQQDQADKVLGIGEETKEEPTENTHVD